MTLPPRAAERGRGTAFARTALAGNPSDGYGGAVLATTFANFSASAEAQPGAMLSVEPPSPLLRATVRRFARVVEPEAAHTQIRWQQAIPREVGLGSSSGLVIATLRALAELHGRHLPTEELAELAHAIEREDLEVPGGRQDQVVQSHEGLVLMEFGEHPGIEALDPGLLPPLLIAYRDDAAQHSGEVHAPLRARFEADAPRVRGVLHELAALARQARDALVARDVERFAATVDASFDARAAIMALDPRHVAMVQAARAAGAAANYSGSGGAIVCVCRDERHRRECDRALRSLACKTATLALDGASEDRAR